MMFNQKTTKKTLRLFRFFSVNPNGHGSALHPFLTYNDMLGAQIQLSFLILILCCMWWHFVGYIKCFAAASNVLLINKSDVCWY